MPDSDGTTKAALELLPYECDGLIESISQSLDGVDLGEEWEAEVGRRVDEVDSGRMRTVSGDEVFSRIEQRLRAR